MSDNSAIEWTDATWNPVTGCSKVSAGCTNCYAEAVSHRFGFTSKPWNATYAAENVQLHSERLDQPLRWKKPRKIFVNSMSDLFHEQVPDEFIERVFAIMSVTPHHTYQILTKRPERMFSWFTSSRSMFVAGAAQEMGFRDRLPTHKTLKEWWPLPNVWLGVSVENQQAADERIPLLLQTPATVRFLSCEPLLGCVDLSTYTASDIPVTDDALDAPDGESVFGMTRHGDVWTRNAKIDWVIVGGESGPNARPMHPDWARSLRDQCQAAGVAFLFKQWGEWAPYVDESRYTHGESELQKFMQHWVRPDGESGVCWIRDDDGTWQNWTGAPGPYAHVVNKWGKKRAGRLLDGRTWDEYPEVTTDK